MFRLVHWKTFAETVLKAACTLLQRSIANEVIPLSCPIPPLVFLKSRSHDDSSIHAAGRNAFSFRRQRAQNCRRDFLIALPGLASRSRSCIYLGTSQLLCDGIRICLLHLHRIVQCALLLERLATVVKSRARFFSFFFCQASSKILKLLRYQLCSQWFCGAMRQCSCQQDCSLSDSTSETQRENNTLRN